MSERLRARLGVATEVAHFPPGGTVELIRLESRHKVIRLVKREIEGAGA
ncbi:hypothetical protein [Alloyangia pacifica]|nr:hypothetical protein [Alloyangia pacifica]